MSIFSTPTSKKIRFITMTQKLLGKRGGCVFLVIFGLALIPIFSTLSREPYWGDEWYTYEAVGKPWGEMISFIATDDCHPPGFYLLTKAWLGISSWVGGKTDEAQKIPEWMLRFPSAFFTGLAVLVMAWLLRKEYPNQRSLAVIFLATCLTSSQVVTFGKMGRYFGWTAFLFSVGLVALHQGNRTGNRLWFIVVGLVNLVAMYSFYLLPLCLFPVQVMASILVFPSSLRPLCWAWLLPAIGFIPHLPTFVSQLAGAGPKEDFLLQEGRGIFFQIPASTIYSMYAFLVGPTIFPWRFWISLPAFVGLLWLAGRGGIFGLRINLGTTKFLLISAVVPIALGVLAMPFLLTRLNYLNYPVRLFFCTPMVWCMVALGVYSLGNLRKKIAACLAILALNGVAWKNSLQGSDLHHYIPPFREIAAMIVRDPASICLSTERNLRPYLGDRVFDIGLTGFPSPASYSTIWIFNSSHRSSAFNPDIARVNAWESFLVASGFVPQGEWGICRDDDFTLAVKRWLRGGEVQRYKMVLKRFVRRTKERAEGRGPAGDYPLASEESGIDDPPALAFPPHPGKEVIP